MTAPALAPGNPARRVSRPAGHATDATLVNVHIVAKSGNAKTGPMPVTYRTAETCPTSCPFLPANQGGCYGTGRIFGIAGKYAGTIIAEQADATLAKRDRGARYLRDRVVGDVVAPDGSFDRGYVLTVAAAAARAGLRPFGYSHAWRTMSADDVATVAASGYAMNASCETPGDIADAMAMGLPTVIVGDTWADGDIVGGRRLITCPAETRDDTTCATCGLCAKNDRAVTVRFNPHGSGKGQATRAVAGLNAA